MPARRSPLHPPVLGEAAAGLLPGEDRHALLWSIALGEDGEPVEAILERSVVRSRRALSYGEAQDLIDTGHGDDTLALLAEVGRLRGEREAARGAVSLSAGWTRASPRTLPSRSAPHASSGVPPTPPGGAAAGSPPPRGHRRGLRACDGAATRSSGRSARETSLPPGPSRTSTTSSPGPAGCGSGAPRASGRAPPQGSRARRPRRRDWRREPG